MRPTLAMALVTATMAFGCSRVICSLGIVDDVDSGRDVMEGLGSSGGTATRKSGWFGATNSVGTPRGSGRYAFRAALVGLSHRQSLLVNPLPG